MCSIVCAVPRKEITVKKKWIIFLYVLVMLSAPAILAYEYYQNGSLEPSHLIRSGLILVGAVLGMVKTLNRVGKSYVWVITNRL